MSFTDAKQADEFAFEFCLLNATIRTKTFISSVKHVLLPHFTYSKLI